jgi:hypothetical protein
MEALRRSVTLTDLGGIQWARQKVCHTETSIKALNIKNLKIFTIVKKIIFN